MNKDYKSINNLWKDSEGYRYFGTLKLSSKIKYDGDDFIPLWEWINQLQQENKILKENAKHNDKVVDKVNWENMLLKKENKQLKALQEKIEDETMSEKIDIQNNWNKLKEYLHNQIPTDKTVLTKHIKIFEVLDKMQELEGSDSNE